MIYLALFLAVLCASLWAGVIYVLCAFKAHPLPPPDYFERFNPPRFRQLGVPDPLRGITASSACYAIPSMSASFEPGARWIVEDP